MLADAVADDRNTPAALVTGGSSAIGKAICELLGHSGYLVAVADRDEVGARAVADACGGIAIAVDVTDEGAVTSMVTRAFEGLGRLDALVTSISAVDAASLDESDEPAALQRLHAIAVLGTFLCIRAAAKRMGFGGRICTIAPFTADIGAGNSTPTAPYAVTAGAVASLTKHAARTLYADGIFVNGIALGTFSVDAAPAPLGERLSAPQQVAEAVAWLLSPRAASVNGEILRVGAELRL